MQVAAADVPRIGVPDLQAQAVRLGPDLLERLEALINQQTVVGPRYNAQATSEVDTETF